MKSLYCTDLPTPAEIKAEFPLSPAARAHISEARRTAASILLGEEDRLVAILGPCSIHDPKSALEYAALLKNFSAKVQHTFFPIMRFFIEKPRTRLGWKGMVYDPHLDGSNDIGEGLRQARKLFVQVAELGVPCATELLEPILVPYFEDLITWGLIGARTSASQPHRQMASGLPFPVGFKNDFNGELDVAIAGILTAKMRHSLVKINDSGKIVACQTEGNFLTHLVLRGADKKPNFDATSVAHAMKMLKSHELQPSLLIDCSHGNSGKDPEKQKSAFRDVLQQVHNGNRAIKGVMIESHLQRGRQEIESNGRLQYGISITDSCLSWEETVALFDYTERE